MTMTDSIRGTKEAVRDLISKVCRSLGEKTTSKEALEGIRKAVAWKDVAALDRRVEIERWAFMDCDFNALEKLLLEKNAAYGNSALEPLRIFASADTVEQIRVRIDDKLSRMARGHDLAGESALEDLRGYLVLLKIAHKLNPSASQPPRREPRRFVVSVNPWTPAMQVMVGERYQTVDGVQFEVLAVETDKPDRILVWWSARSLTGHVDGKVVDWKTGRLAL